MLRLGGDLFRDETRAKSRDVGDLGQAQAWVPMSGCSKALLKTSQVWRRKRLKACPQSRICTIVPRGGFADICSGSEF